MVNVEFITINECMLHFIYNTNIIVYIHAGIVKHVYSAYMVWHTTDF